MTPNRLLLWAGTVTVVTLIATGYPGWAFCLTLGWIVGGVHCLGLERKIILGDLRDEMERLEREETDPTARFNLLWNFTYRYDAKEKAVEGST
jgi:hypothetical protein